MPKLMGVVLLLALGTAASSCDFASERGRPIATEAGWSTYHNSPHGFSISYPSTAALSLKNSGSEYEYLSVDIHDWEVGVEYPPRDFVPDSASFVRHATIGSRANATEIGGVEAIHVHDNGTTESPAGDRYYVDLPRQLFIISVVNPPNGVDTDVMARILNSISLDK